MEIRNALSKDNCAIVDKASLRNPRLYRRCICPSCGNCRRGGVRGFTYSLRHEGEIEDVDNPIAVNIHRRIGGYALPQTDVRRESDPEY